MERADKKGSVNLLSSAYKKQERVRIIYLFYVLVYFVSYTYLGVQTNTNNILSLVVMAISASGTLIVYHLSTQKPVKAMLLLVIIQSLVGIEGVLEGKGFISNLGIIYLLSIVALLIHIILADKNMEKRLEKQGKSIKDKTLKERIGDILNYEKPLYKVDTASRLVIWTIVISSIIGYSGIGFKEYEFDGVFSLYASMSVIVPTLILLACLTTSRILIDMYVIYIGLEVYTIVILSIAGIGINIVDIVSIVMDIVNIWIILIGDRGNEEIREKSGKKNIKAVKESTGTKGNKEAGRGTDTATDRSTDTATDTETAENMARAEERERQEEA